MMKITREILFVVALCCVIFLIWAKPTEANAVEYSFISKHLDQETLESANVSEEHTNVPAPVIIAVAWVETKIGTDNGKTISNRDDDPIKTKDKNVLASIVRTLELDRNSIPVSKSGAMGTGQFLASTWGELGGHIHSEYGVYRPVDVSVEEFYQGEFVYSAEHDKVRKALKLDGPSNPYNLSHAFVAIGLLLKEYGYDRSKFCALHKYNTGLECNSRFKNDYPADVKQAEIALRSILQNASNLFGEDKNANDADQILLAGACEMDIEENNSTQSEQNEIAEDNFLSFVSYFFARINNTTSLSFDNSCLDSIEVSVIRNRKFISDKDKVIIDTTFPNGNISFDENFTTFYKDLDIQPRARGSPVTV